MDAEPAPVDPADNASADEEIGQAQRAEVFTLAQLAERVHGKVAGDPGTLISGLGSLETAQPGEISHLSSPTYRRYLRTTRASAVILNEEDAAAWAGVALVVSNPYLAFARISQLFARRPSVTPGIDPAARIAPDAVVEESACISAGVIVGPGSRVGARVRLFGNVVIGENCTLAEDVVLMPNVVLYTDVRIGARTVVHSGAVIGADGFGYAPDEQMQLEAIAQVGGVSIGADVSVGACTSIDRGAIGDTVIEDGVKIDNQVQIGHNCHIGAHSVVCGCVGIVGSTRLGRHCVLAGGVGIGGDGPIEICDHVVVSGMTHVSSSIDEPGVYSGGVIHNDSHSWKKNALRFQKLDELSRRVKALEKQLEEGAEGEGF